MTQTEDLCGVLCICYEDAPSATINMHGHFQGLRQMAVQTELQFACLLGGQSHDLVNEAAQNNCRLLTRQIVGIQRGLQIGELFLVNLRGIEMPLDFRFSFAGNWI